MALHLQKAKTILKKGKSADSWFGCRYSLNLYRGCAHNCVYCDGRSERYHGEGTFGTDIAAKINAPEILQSELSIHRRRKPLTPGWTVFGGGVADSYQPAESALQISRACLTVFKDLRMPVHLITKSSLVVRDLDILQKCAGTLVSISLSTSDESLAQIVEPGVPSPRVRLETLSKLKNRGIHCGVFLMPVIPFLSDSDQAMMKTVQDIRDAGAEYIVFSPMTLRPKIQKEYYLKMIRSHFPQLVRAYEATYPDDPWGNPDPKYTQRVHETFLKCIHHNRIPSRIPVSLFLPFLPETDYVCIILAQLDYLLQLHGKKAHFGRTIQTVRSLRIPLAFALANPPFTSSISQESLKIIEEIAHSGRCRLYESLLFDGVR